MSPSMLSPVVAGALRAAMAERLVVNHAQEAYKAAQSEYRRALRDAACPCHNDPFGNGPCTDCRAEVVR